MTTKYIPAELQRWLTTLGERYEYCRTSEVITGSILEADHILPRSQGGKTERSNLCRACSACNLHKSNRTHAVDPLTSQRVALFHPRQQRWSEHFTWDEEGVRILGVTPTGRATVDALKMNNPVIVRARLLWQGFGWHPPAE
jgi:hypothetical protein